MKVSRRSFLERSSATGAALFASHCSLGQLISAITGKGSRVRRAGRIQGQVLWSLLGVAGRISEGARLDRRLAPQAT